MIFADFMVTLCPYFGNPPKKTDPVKIEQRKFEVSQTLLHNGYLYYRTDINYWRCINADCNCTVTTTGETVNDNIKRQSKQTHLHLERAEIECKLSATQIKERIAVIYVNKLKYFV